jgi:hypothetical protein
MSKLKFCPKKNKQLVLNQQRIHNAFRALVQRNGIKCYVNDRKRTEKVVRHYLKVYQLVDTSVERFWYLNGTSILIGKVV